MTRGRQGCFYEQIIVHQGLGTYDCLGKQLVQRSIDECIVGRIYPEACRMPQIEGIGRNSAFGICATRPRTNRRQRD